MYSSSLDAEVHFNLKVTVSKSGDDFIITDVRTLGGKSIMPLLSESDFLDIQSIYLDALPKDKLEGEHLIENFPLPAIVMYTFSSYEEDKIRYFDDIKIEEVILGEGNKAFDALDSVSPKFKRKLYYLVNDDLSKSDDDFLYKDPEDDLDESVEYFNKKLDKLTDRLERRLRRSKVKSKLVGKGSKIPGFSYWFQK